MAESEHAGTAVESYRDLRVGRAAIELAVACYSETRAFPTSENYGLVAQVWRSSVSIAANIAEGYGRNQIGSYVQFLRVAQSSLKELETHVIIAQRVGYLEAVREASLLSQCDEIGRMLVALIRSLQRNG